MATKKHVKELVKARKFTPGKYSIRIFGWGVEVVMGTVAREKYDYFLDNEIDISDYLYDLDIEIDVPEDMQPVERDNWFMCDDIAHVTGAELNNLCRVFVEDEKGQEVWSSPLEPDPLEDQGVEVKAVEIINTASQKPGTVVLLSWANEKGNLANIYPHLDAPFDPRKLSIEYIVVENWKLVTNLVYDGEILDNLPGAVNQKSLDSMFIVVGDENLAHLVGHL